MDSENNSNAVVETKKTTIEEALDQAGFGLYSYLLTLLTGLTIISLACVAYSTMIIVPTAACELETTSAQQGLQVALPLIGALPGAILWGYLADKHGRRSMLMASLACACATNAVASISVNWIMLSALQVLGSFFASGQYAMSMTLLSESVPLAKRNLVVFVVASIFMLSQGIMALIAIPIIPLNFSFEVPLLNIYWNPWRTVLLVYCIPSILCVIFFAFMQESPKFAFAKGDEPRALDIMRTIHRMNNGRKSGEFQVKSLEPEVAPPTGDEKQEAPMSLLFKMPLVKNLIIITSLFIFLKVSAFTVWLPVIANQYVEIFRTGESGGLTLCDIIQAGNEAAGENEVNDCTLNETSLLIVFALGALQSVFNLCLSLVVGKAGRRNTVIVVAAVCGVSGILVNLVPNAIASGLLFMVFLMAMVLMGLYTAISVALFPTSLRAIALSIAQTGGRLVLFAVVQLVNYLLENNCDLAFYIFCSFVAVSAVIASFLPDDRLIKPAEIASAKDVSEPNEEKQEIEKEIPDTMTRNDEPQRNDSLRQRL